MISEALLDDRHTVAHMPERGARLLMYAHDTYGLGHLRRITDLLSSHPRLRQRVSA